MKGAAAYAVLAAVLGWPHPEGVAIVLLNALGGWLLFTRVLGSRSVGWLCGALLASSPVVARDGGLLLFLLLAMLFVMRGEWGRALVLALVATAFDPCFGIFLALFAAWRLGVAALAGLALALAAFGPPPLDLATLPADSPLLTSAADLSAAPWLLLIVGAGLLHRPRPWRWAGCLGLFYALSLGPCLKVAWLPNPVYLLAYKVVPGFASVQDLHHLGVMVTVAACALAGFAATAAARTVGGWRFRLRALVYAAVALQVGQAIWLLYPTSASPEAAVPPPPGAASPADERSAEEAFEDVATMVLALEARGVGLTPDQAAEVLPLVARLDAVDARQRELLLELRSLLTEPQARFVEARVAGVPQGPPFAWGDPPVGVRTLVGHLALLELPPAVLDVLRRLKGVVQERDGLLHAIAGVRRENQQASGGGEAIRGLLMSAFER